MILRGLALLAALAAGAMAAPVSSPAQQTAAVRRIGMLETTPPALNAANLEAFRAAMQEHGWTVGKNLVIEYRSADGHVDRFPNLAAELVRLKVEVVVTRGTPAALAAKKATETIPIVTATIGDPVSAGVVGALSSPGGNVTGVTTTAPDVSGKRLAILKEAVPTVTRVAVVANLGNPAVAASRQQREAAAKGLGLQLIFVDVRRADEFERAFEAARAQRADGVTVALDPVTQNNRQRIVDLANRHRLPAIYAEREFAEAGGLLSYSVSHPGVYRQAALFVDKILRGARPAELPLESPKRFAFVVNLKTARAIGVTLPSSVLLLADQVIQ